jgi:hypothetical protein
MEARPGRPRLLRTPKTAEESEDYWCNRVRNAAFEQVEQAADLGTMIHGALELAMAANPTIR